MRCEVPTALLSPEVALDEIAIRLRPKQEHFNAAPPLLDVQAGRLLRYPVRIEDALRRIEVGAAMSNEEVHCGATIRGAAAARCRATRRY